MTGTTGDGAAVTHGSPDDVWQPWQPGLRYRAIETPDIRVVELDVQARVAVSAHTEALPHICCIVHGTAVERAGGRSLAVRRGSARLSPAGATHDIVYGERPVRAVVLHLTASWFRPWTDPWGACRVEERPAWMRFTRALQGATIRDPARIVDLVAWLTQRAQETTSGADGDVVREVGRHAVTDTGVLRVAQRIADCPGAPLSLRDAAALAQRSPAAMARTFRACFGVTLGQYMRRARADAARTAIEHGALSFAQIAHDCGYADQSHLTHAMRMYWGRTPAALRAAARPPRA